MLHLQSAGCGLRKGPSGMIVMPGEILKVWIICSSKNKTMFGELYIARSSVIQKMWPYPVWPKRRERLRSPFFHCAQHLPLGPLCIICITDCGSSDLHFNWLSITIGQIVTYKWSVNKTSNETQEDCDCVGSPEVGGVVQILHPSLLQYFLNLFPAIFPNLGKAPLIPVDCVNFGEEIFFWTSFSSCQSWAVFSSHMASLFCFWDWRMGHYVDENL